MTGPKRTSWNSTDSLAIVSFHIGLEGWNNVLRNFRTENVANAASMGGNGQRAWAEKKTDVKSHPNVRGGQSAGKKHTPFVSSPSRFEWTRRARKFPERGDQVRKGR